MSIYVNLERNKFGTHTGNLAHWVRPCQRDDSDGAPNRPGTRPEFLTLAARAVLGVNLLIKYSSITPSKSFLPATIGRMGVFPFVFSPSWNTGSQISRPNNLSTCSI